MTRDASILTAHADGHTLRAIAAEVGISHEGVRKVLIRHGAIKPKSKSATRAGVIAMSRAHVAGQVSA